MTQVAPLRCHLQLQLSLKTWMQREGQDTAPLPSHMHREIPGSGRDGGGEGVSAGELSVVGREGAAKTHVPRRVRVHLDASWPLLDHALTPSVFQELCG